MGMGIHGQPFDWKQLPEAVQSKAVANLDNRIIKINEEMQGYVKDRSFITKYIFINILGKLGLGETGKAISHLNEEKKQIESLLHARTRRDTEPKPMSISEIPNLIQGVENEITRLEPKYKDNKEKVVHEYKVLSALDRIVPTTKSPNETKVKQLLTQLNGLKLIESVTNKVLPGASRPPAPTFRPAPPKIVSDINQRLEQITKAKQRLSNEYKNAKLLKETPDYEESLTERDELVLDLFTKLEEGEKKLLSFAENKAADPAAIRKTLAETYLVLGDIKDLPPKKSLPSAPGEPHVGKSALSQEADSESTAQDVDESMADSIYDDSEEEWGIPEWGIISTKQSSSENQMGKVDVLLNDAAAKLREVANDKTKNIKIETANGKLSLVVTSRPLELPISIDVKDRSANAFIYLLAIVEKASKNPETVQQSKEMLNDLRSSNWGTTVLDKPKYQDLQKKVIQLDAQIESYTEEVAGNQLAKLKESVSRLRDDKLRIVNNELTATEWEGTKGISKQSQLAMWTALVRLEAAVAKTGFTSDALDVMAILKSSPWGKAVLSIPYIKAKFDSIESQVNTIDDPKVLAYRFCTLRDLVKENEKPENADKALVFKNGVFALEQNAPLALREDAVRQSSLLLRVLCDKLTDESMIGEIKRVYKDGLFPDSKLPATFAEASIINLKDGIAKLSKDILSGNKDLRVHLVGHFIERVYSDSFQAASDISLLFKRQETNLRKMFDHFQDEEKIKDDEGVVFKWDDIANGPNIIGDCIKSYDEWKRSGFDDTQKDAKIDTGVKTPIFKFKSFISEVCKRAEKEITGPETVEAKKRLTNLKDMMRKNAGANAQPLDLVELEEHIDWFARQIK